MKNPIPKKFRKGTTIILAIMALIVPIWLFYPPKTSTLQKITIAQTGDFFLYAPLYIALDGGYFRKNGLDVSIISTGGDEKTWAAVLGKNASFGIADPTFIAISDERGIPGRVIASIVNGVPFWGITMNSSIKEVQSPQDLNSYSVATFPSPSTAYTLQKKMFLDAGLKPNIKEGAFGTLLYMLQSGKVDIALELEPNVSQASSNGAKVLYSLAKLYGDFAITGLTTTPELLKSDTALAKKVVCSI
ncbi:MAG TPA: ABC transporter substrate-binding protein, partial [Bacteroidia bacterium]|nr:ABC transporter substrate-binding protein [Bacteroidia bacterium]